MLRPVVSALAVLCVAACASAFGPDKCPLIVPGKIPFDPLKGEWHLAAGCRTTMELKGKCGKYNIVAQKVDDKYSLPVALSTRFSGKSSKDDSPNNLEILATGKIGSMKMGVGFSVLRKEGSSSYSGVYKESVIASDYENYAVYMACKPEFDPEKKIFTRTMFAEIWARPGVTLSKDRMDTLINLLTSYDIDPADIKIVENTTC